MSGFLETILAFLVVLPPIIFFHELGHFLAARWCGVRVLRFSLGFGPRIVSFTRGNTEYRLAWIPLGGMVRMAGESLEDATRMSAPDEFLSQPWWKRAVIAVGGPAMNLVLAFLVLVAMYRVGGKFEDYPAVLGRLDPRAYAVRLGLQPGDRLTALDGHAIASWMDFYMTLTGPESAKHPRHVLGYARPSASGAAASGQVSFPDRDLEDFAKDLVAHRPPVIGSVLVGGSAYLAGLKDGDRIVSVNGQPIREWTDLSDIIFVSAGKPLLFHVRRGGRDLDFRVVPQAQEDGPRGGRVGIAAQSTEFYYSKGAPWPRAVAAGWSSAWFQVGQTYSGLARLVTRPRQFSQQVGGPIMIGQLAGYEARRGLADLLWFGAFISVAIMAFNLLPIPILDGGHVLFALVEAVQRRPLSIAQLLLMQRIGLAVLGSILVFVLLNDSWRLVQRARSVASGESGSPAVPRGAP